MSHPAATSPYRIPQQPDETGKRRWVDPSLAREYIERLLDDLRSPNLTSPAYPAVETADIMTTKSAAEYESALILLETAAECMHQAQYNNKAYKLSGKW